MLATLFIAGAVREALEADITPLDARVHWTKGAPADQSSPIHLTFLLQQQNVDRLEAALTAASDPASPTFGQHMSNEAVHALVAPSPMAYRRVVEFLRSHGLDPTNATINGDMLSVRTRVGIAERLLECNYHEYTHADGTTALRTPRYSLPAAVAAAVAAVAPTVQLPLRGTPLMKAQAVDMEAPPNALFNTPHSLRKLYSVNAVQGSSPTNRMAVTAFLGQRFSQGDLNEFYKLFMNNSAFDEAHKRPITLKGDDGGKALIGGVEAMLDIEYSTALGANISSEFWGFQGRAPDEPENEPFLKWLTQLANTPDEVVPKVFSTSYGEDESSTAMAYAKRLNVEFVKAGVRGISLLFAAGDSGAAGDRGCAGAEHDHFVAQWPAGSPFVTAVGGTAGLISEEAASLSSGGFSSRYARPRWQEAVVTTYLSTAILPTTGPNATALKWGRAFPDISAQAVDFMVVAFRLPSPVAGTSCASPTAAGVIALLNDARLAAGKATLGFLNPWLYANAAALNDITTGSNHGCRGHGGGKGYPAVKGWDAVTGLGTPNYEKMLQALEDLP